MNPEKLTVEELTLELKVSRKDRGVLKKHIKERIC